MNITIIGFGNIGTQFAVEFTSAGYPVTVYSQKPQSVSKNLTILYDDGTTTKQAQLHRITSSLQEAIENADLIIISRPAFMLAQTAEEVYPYVKAGACVALIPGTGGGELALKRHIEEKGVTVFGLQRVPAVARLTEYGNTVRVSGKREKLFAGAIPKENGEKYAKLFSRIFDMPCEMLPNYLCVTLTPSNPILHTTRLRCLFKDYTQGKAYPTNPYFYQSWDDESSRLLCACDEELQTICKALDKLDLTGVRSLKEHYASETPEQLTQKMRSIKSLQGLLSPMIQTESGWIPDFSSRYFTADFPFGLAIIAQIARLAGVETPNIDETLAWGTSMGVNQTALALDRYGIRTLDDLLEFYA